MTEKERIRKDIAHRLSVAETMLVATPNNEAWHLVYSELKSILSFIDESENKNETIIWHNADEEPQENTKIIWYATGDCIKMCTHTKDMVHGGMTKWAYAEELLNLKTQEPIEVLPKIKGWIARDLCGTVNLHSKKPIWKEDFQMWECGEDFYPIEDCLEENTMFPELNYYDNPIEVEITIKY